MIVIQLLPKVLAKIIGYLAVDEEGFFQVKNAIPLHTFPLFFPSQRKKLRSGFLTGL